MAEAILNRLNGVLAPVINGAWGEYSFFRALLVAKFGCLDAADRGKTLEVLCDVDGAKVLKKVVEMGKKLLEIADEEGAAACTEERKLFAVADENADRQLHAWAYQVELGVLGVETRAIVPVWEARSAAGRGETGAEEKYRNEWSRLAEYLKMLFGVTEREEPAIRSRLVTLKSAVERNEIEVDGMKQPFSDIGSSVRRKGFIDEGLLGKAIMWVKGQPEGKQEEDFIGLLRALAAGVSENHKAGVAEFMASSRVWMV